jgi:NADPH:quinone reductase-like Zn-dependent oxidoreductase
MKAAIVDELGRPPAYRDFDEPRAGEGEAVVAVTASALTNFTKVRAAGKHHSCFRVEPPFVVGIDGVGTIDGRRVYFMFPRAPFGGMAEATVVRSSQCIAVPDDVDDVTLAALADPGMSAWVALESRAKLARGETVLVNGATGTAGGIAVQLAKQLGARRVIATGRNRRVLDSLDVDGVIALPDDAGALRAQFARGVDIVLDYLWGPSAEAILAAAAAATSKAPIRFVQIGTASATDITLSGMLLRATTVELLGSGIASVGFDEIVAIINRLMQSAARFSIAAEAVPLARIADVWSTETSKRIVFVT